MPRLTPLFTLVLATLTACHDGTPSAVAATGAPDAPRCVDGVCETWDSRRALPTESTPPGCPVGDPTRVYPTTAPGRTVEGLGPCDPPPARIGAPR
jgi:hypothetical protein